MQITTIIVEIKESQQSLKNYFERMERNNLLQPAQLLTYGTMRLRTHNYDGEVKIILGFIQRGLYDLTIKSS